MIPASETPRQAWARCAPYIAAALEHDRGAHRIEDVAAMIARGEAHFWPGKGCAVVTVFHLYPRLKACGFWLLGGDLKELLQMQPVIEAWARAQGCRRMLGGGPRKGWARLLRTRGYAPGWTLYFKELTP